MGGVRWADGVAGIATALLGVFWMFMRRVGGDGLGNHRSGLGIVTATALAVPGVVGA